MLLTGVLLLTREFIAPGRIVPGVLGGLGIVLGVYGLSAYRVDLVGCTLLVSAVLVLLFQVRSDRWIWWVSGAAVLGAVGALNVIRPPWRLSSAVVLATVPVIAALGYLLRAAHRASKNKMADLRS